MVCFFDKNFFLNLLILAPITSIYGTKQENIEAIVKETAQTAMQQYQIPGMAIVLYANNKPYFLNLGYTDKFQKTPVTNTTIFEIGSITKIFTCLLIAQEIIDSHMQLNASISTYIPAIAKNKKLKVITLEKLATHTSTLPFNAPAYVKSQKDLIKYLLQWHPENTKKLWFAYSNHGTELLRIALEESLHEPFNQLIIKKILSPLNMSPVGVYVPENYKFQQATPYGKDGNPSATWQHPFYWGTGALRASSSDMLQFLKAALGLPETPVSIKKAMQLTQTPRIALKKNIKYGMGWQINDIKTFRSINNINVFKCPATKIKKEKQIFNCNAVFDKTGTTDGFHAYIAAIPGKKTGIVIMINRAIPRGYTVVKNLGKEILLKTHALSDHHVY